MFHRICCKDWPFVAKVWKCHIGWLGFGSVGLAAILKVELWDCSAHIYGVSVSPRAVCWAEDGWNQQQFSGRFMLCNKAISRDLGKALYGPGNNSNLIVGWTSNVMWAGTLGMSATSLWAGHQMLCGLGHWACQQSHCGLDINFYVGWDIGHASNLIVGRTSNVMWAGTLSMSATSLWAGQPLCRLGHWACQQHHCGLDINFDVGWDIEHVSNLFVG